MFKTTSFPKRTSPRSSQIPRSMIFIYSMKYAFTNRQIRLQHHISVIAPKFYSYACKLSTFMLSSLITFLPWKLVPFGNSQREIHSRWRIMPMEKLQCKSEQDKHKTPSLHLHFDYALFCMSLATVKIISQCCLALA